MLGGPSWMGSASSGSAAASGTMPPGAMPGVPPPQGLLAGMSPLPSPPPGAMNPGAMPSWLGGVPSRNVVPGSPGVLPGTMPAGAMLPGSMAPASIPPVGSSLAGAPPRPPGSLVLPPGFNMAMPPGGLPAMPPSGPQLILPPGAMLGTMGGAGPTVVPPIRPLMLDLMKPLAAPKKGSSVFVGNIAYEAKEEELREVCSKAGAVASVRLVRDKTTGEPKGYAFCDFVEAGIEEAAIEKLSGTEFHGRQLRVDRTEMALRRTGSGTAKAAATACAAMAVAIPADIIRSGQPCRFGRACKSVQCVDEHPEGRDIEMNPQTAVCKFGVRCKRQDCFYMHPEGRQIDSDPSYGICKLGVNCDRADCLYTHPPERVTPKTLRTCYNCGENGHLARDCTKKPTDVPASGTPFFCNGFPECWSTLGHSMLEMRLGMELEQFGPLASKLIMSADGKSATGSFVNAENALAAVEKLNGMDLRNEQERGSSRDHCSFAMSIIERTQTQNDDDEKETTLFIGGCPQRWTSNDVKEFMRGTVKDHPRNIVVLPNGEGVHVVFGSKDAVDRAHRDMKGQKICGKPLAIKKLVESEGDNESSSPRAITQGTSSSVVQRADAPSKSRDSSRASPSESNAPQVNGQPPAPSAPIMLRPHSAQEESTRRTPETAPAEEEAELTDEEKALANAVLAFLVRWQTEHADESSKPNLIHLGGDADVRRCKAVASLRAVNLGTWMKQRISREVTVGQNENGKTCVWFTGEPPPAKRQRSE